MQLLERDQFLASLTADLQAAASGAGRTVLVSGEARIGKTSLLEHFVHGNTTEHVLWGACEALFTPHPLGPLHDLARKSQGRLKTMLIAGGIGEGVDALDSAAAGSAADELASQVAARGAARAAARVAPPPAESLEWIRPEGGGAGTSAIGKAAGGFTTRMRF